MKPKGTGKIEHERDAEEKMAATLEQQAAPGLYLSGKKLVGTRAINTDQLLLEFEGDWNLLITGVFSIRLLESRMTNALPDDENTIDGEAHEETELEKRLLGHGE